MLIVAPRRRKLSRGLVAVPSRETAGGIGIMALIFKAALVIGGLYIVAVIGAYFLQRRLTYAPDVERVDPKSLGLANIEERVINTPDGEKVIAWWGRPKPGMPTLLYFHGNAGSLASRSERIAKYSGRGYGIFMMTYRGYGGSTGSPSERANIADAKLAYDTLTGAGVAAADLIIYGESLGTGVAVQVAASRPAAGVILDAPYTSLVDVAEVHYPRLPARSLMTDRYDTLRYIREMKAPLLIIHGKEDRTVPVEMGRAVLAAAPGPKEMAIFPGAGHSDHYSFGSYDAIYDWIGRLRRGAEPGRAAVNE